MKILVVCQHYWPEPYPLQDVCEELVRRGHEVDLITGVPNYPMGITYPEYKRGKNRRQQVGGVDIHRTFTIPRRKNVLFRFLNYYSFAWSSTRRAKKLRKEYDVVFVNQTSPVMMACAALAYGKKHGKKVVLYCMDLWPASLAAGGVGAGSPIYKFFDKVSRKIYRQADRILITSEMFRAYLRDELGIADEKIGYHPQYAVMDPVGPPPRKDTVDLMFAGNIGTAQSIPTILKAAQRLRDREELRWHILGDGSELERCRSMARQMELENVIFHGRKSAEEMPRYYAMADAMLVTLTADKFIGMTLPGKVQTCMAAGKPVIAAANGETARTIEKSGCGFRAPAEDDEALAEAVRAFLRCEDKARLGDAARRYFEEHFSRQRFMDALERELREQAL